MGFKNRKDNLMNKSDNLFNVLIRKKLRKLMDFITEIHIFAPIFIDYKTNQKYVKRHSN